MDETNILKPAPISTRQLTWVPKDRQYVGEISSTRGFGRVFADAIDEGLTLVSAKTGTEVVFVVDDVVHNSEHEIESWVLKPVGRNSIQDVRVHLFND